MSSTVFLILGGCLLGVLQLIAGIAIGWWLHRMAGDGADLTRRQEMQDASEIAKRLQDLADEMASSVGAHSEQLHQATELLAGAENKRDESLAELVVEVIGDIVRANQSLQTKLELAERRLQEQAAEIEACISRALTDPLTGLPNRRDFDDRLEERMAGWKRRQEVFSLLLIDIDHFKKLNDEHGHLAGDLALAAIGRVLRAAVRRDDAVARFGGEEFAVLLPNTTVDQAALVAEEVRESVAAEFINLSGQQLKITLSCGLAAITVNEASDSLIQRADAALYAAKSAGRNCSFLHDGINCRSVLGDAGKAPRQASRSAEIIQLINTPESQRKPTALDAADFDIGPFLPREAVSEELAKTCEELRILAEQRARNPHEALVSEATQQ